jgi:hypothetical protein
MTALAAAAELRSALGWRPHPRRVRKGAASMRSLQATNEGAASVASAQRRSRPASRIEHAGWSRSWPFAQGASADASSCRAAMFSPTSGTIARRFRDGTVREHGILYGSRAETIQGCNGPPIFPISDHVSVLRKGDCVILRPHNWKGPRCSLVVAVRLPKNLDCEILVYESGGFGPTTGWRGSWPLLRGFAKRFTICVSGGFKSGW